MRRNLFSHPQKPLAAAANALVRALSDYVSSNTKEWVKLISLVIGTGSAVTVTSYLGGAKLWIAILCGLGTGATNVYHALKEPAVGERAGQSSDAPNPT